MREPIPRIGDREIDWVCDVLGLDPDSFRESERDSARRRALTSRSTQDIEACPGGGKTTLLVAKIGLVLRTWTSLRRGICVLSHTNVARDQITARLTNTSVGETILRYPHFIGTIHGFVNEFLALPALRSRGIVVELVDDDITLDRRWRRLPYGIRFGLEKKRLDRQVLRCVDTRCRPRPIPWGKRSLGENTSTYQGICKVLAESTRDGYFCHDEMFIWASALLDEIEDVQKWIRGRFPILFIDEVQDNSEMQSQILQRVFMEGPSPVIRQRFGDSNQAIYEDISGTSAQTDAFPNQEVRISLQNSYRFDQTIADLVNPLGVVPQGLAGLRPTTKDTGDDMRGLHAVFLFDPENVAHVLGSYAEYLVEVFTPEQLRNGSFTAVGAVHRRAEDDKVPRSVSHYWKDYDPEFGQMSKQPTRFLEHVMRGEKVANKTGQVGPFVESVALGVLRTARRLDETVRRPPVRRPHSYLLEQLADNHEMRRWYESLIAGLCVERIPLTRRKWEGKWRQAVLAIARAVARSEKAESGDIGFLDWTGTSDIGGGTHMHRRGEPNVYEYPAGAPEVKIQIGSIHSVKGETHTATLVMETFYRAHHLRTLKGWLVGSKSGGEQESDATRARLRQHYVAMSRPTHLLCLAMREDALNASDIDRLMRHGWRVGRAGLAKTEWITGQGG